MIEPPFEVERVFEVTDEEIESGEISIFLGDPTDFIAYKFAVLESFPYRISGLAERSSDAGPEVWKGIFEARTV